MARARNIKPGIMANEDLAELDPLARLLFIYLWMLADREGRLEDRPKRIKAEALPYDNVDADLMLDDLAKAGFIHRYEAAGVKLIQVLNFAKHQTPHVREQASSLPGVDAEQPKREQGTTEEVPGNNQGCAEQSPRSPDSLIPDSLIPEEEHVDADASTHSAPQQAAEQEPGSGQTAQLFQIDRIPYEKIRDLYNQILGGKLKRCMGVTEAHRKHIRAAYNLKLDGGFPVRDGGLSFWEGLFNDVLDCPFMLGNNNRGWRADFEFLTTASKIQRFMEGKYDAA
ncbi:phage replication protein [Pseudomonas aeruginosa]|nr:phage replication protein [Pseudomonas aeruginosa]HEJ4688036.1 phage replication protein [Pseudomonas aeruginosa]